MIRKSSSHSGAGFTLVELMITIAIVAILLTVVAPSLFAFLLSTRLASQAKDIVSDVRLARSEAAARGQWVVMCPSTDGTTCTNTVATWPLGRVVFVDTNRNGTLDSGEAILQYSAALPGSTNVATTGFGTAVPITFNPYGAMMPLGTTGTFTLCSASSRDGTQIAINGIGKASVTKITTCP